MAYREDDDKEREGSDLMEDLGKKSEDSEEEEGETEVEEEEKPWE